VTGHDVHRRPLPTPPQQLTFEEFLVVCEPSVGWRGWEEAKRAYSAFRRAHSPAGPEGGR
jgi:hypothetical protein